MSITQYINKDIAKITPYQPGRPIEEVARDLGLDPAGIVKLASNECPLGPSPKALEAMHQLAPEMNLYPDGGAYYLRHRLAPHLQVKPEELIFGNGSNELLLFIAQCLLWPGRSAVASAHAFAIYKLLTTMLGAELIEVPMRGLTHDLEAMAAAVSDDTRVIFVCNPNNPTGTMVTNEEVVAFMEKIPEGVLVVFDEAYAEIALQEMPDTMKYFREGRDVIILHTFSKAYGLAGLRLGYGIANREIVESLEKPRQPFNVNRMAQLTAAAAIEDEKFLEESKEVYRNGYEMISAFCEDAGLTYEPTAANFILIKVGDGAKFHQELEKCGVIVRPMAGYQLPEWIRVSFGVKAENEKFIAAMQEIV